MGFRTSGKRKRRVPSSNDHESAVAPAISEEQPTRTNSLIPTFELTTSTHSYISNLTSKDDQQDALFNVAYNWSRAHDTLDSVAEKIDDLATELDLRDIMEKDETGIWDRVTVQAKVARSQRSGLDTAKETVYNLLGRDNVERDFVDIQGDAFHTWKYLRSLANICATKNIAYNDLKLSVLQAQLKRISENKRGTSSARIIVAKDFIDARNIIKSNCLKPREELCLGLFTAGYSMTAKNFIDTSTDGHESDNPVPHIEFETVRLAANVHESEQMVSVLSQIQPDRSVHSQLQLSEGVIRASQNLVAESEDHTEDEHEEDFDENSGQEVYESSSDDAAYDSDYDDDLGDDEKSRKRRKKNMHQCGCSGEIPKGFIKQLVSRFRPDPLSQSKLIRKWANYRTIGRMCYIHTRLTFSALGMKSKGRLQGAMEVILSQYHTAVLNNKLGDFKSDEETYDYFRSDARPQRPDDLLGVYKYAHDKTANVLKFTEADQATLQAELGIDMTGWNATGSVNIDGMSWWKAGDFVHDGMTIFDVAELEYEMYDHHNRAVRGSNYGWLRNMYHGLVQQVMRQDPWYWMLYVALRGDQKHDLVSYPYYAKYQKEGDSTFFRHIDISLPRLGQSEQGLYLIQGTLSLDDEKENDCTEILPGMHKHIDEWTADLLKRTEVKLGGAIHAIGSKEYTPEDEMKYGIGWTPVPCKALQVRTTDPRIPHGAMGPARGVRRTMLPWYVSLQTGLQHLEIGDAGTFEDLAKAHCDLTPGPRSPSGHPNNHGTIPYRFPAAVHLTGLGSLSDALVCRIRHDFDSVIAIKKVLLLGGPDARNVYLHQWRRKAVVAVVEAWKQVETLEREKFGEKSFFWRQDMMAQGEDVVIAEDIDKTADGNLELGYAHGAGHD